MRRFFLLSALFLSTLMSAFAVDSDEQTAIPVMPRTVYYDGYEVKTIYDTDLDDGIFRPDNSLRCVRLTESQYDAFGDDLQLRVSIYPQCDNYDRMGLVRLAFVEKGAETYDPEKVEKIELARFITPFMNRNKLPKRVNFLWDIPDVAYIFHDPALRAKYDFWIETYIFGMPYSAQTQVAGCEGRVDVYSASVDFFTSGTGLETLAEQAKEHRLIPVYTTKSEIYGPVNLNNYKEEACDELGVTTRTFRFTAEEDMADAQIYLILTNHGAGDFGEEYNRRTHFIYLDGENILTYKPGGFSCEPYRRYNSQGNGIYGREPLPDEEWTWNNWCPGSPQPIRRIALGELKAGKHEIKISVPDAEFYNKDGDFRPSIHVQGMRQGQLPTSAVDGIAGELIAEASFSRHGDEIRFSLPGEIRDIQLFDAQGVLLEGSYQPEGYISLADRPEGVYILVVTQRDGRYALFKTMR